MIRVLIKYAASQETWTEVEMSNFEYQHVFQSGKFQGNWVAYIWPANSPIAYDCEARQWMVASTQVKLLPRFVAHARSMTAKDRFNVRKLIHDCLKTKHDLGENE